MQSKCNEYNRQQSEHSRSLDLARAATTEKFSWKMADQTIVYPLYSAYSIFTRTWISIVFNCPSSFIQCSVVLWLRLCSREIVCTCRTFRTFVRIRIAVFLNSHCKTNMTHWWQKEKNIISVRSLTAVLHLLEKETAEERWTHQTHHWHIIL